MSTKTKTRKKPAAKSVRMPPGVGMTPEAKAEAEAKAKAKAEAKAMKELADLYADVENPKPHLECRIFPLPSYCTVSSVAMRELDGEDDIMSAYWADQNATAAEQGSANAAAIADQREGIRISLVGVNGRQINDDGSCFLEANEWSSKTWRFLMQCFAELNGVSHDDLKNAVRGSVPIGTSPRGNGSNQGSELSDG